MKNHSSLDTTVTFTSYGSSSPINYFFFTLTFVVYLLSIFCNVFLRLVIYFDSSMHKPMYIFLFNLAINGLIGSSTVLPKIMENLLSDSQTISFRACLIQVFWVYFYMTSAYTTFSVMVYDRYISICMHLQYHSIVTPGKVKTLLTVANGVPMSALSLLVHLLSRLQLCKYTNQNLFCDIMTLFNQSCVKSALFNLYVVCLITSLVGFPCVVVLLSYAVILNVSLKASKDAQKKALGRCSPHLITFINFGVATLFFAVYLKHSSFLPGEVYILITADWFAVPPLVNPIIYGIRTQEIRKCVVKTVMKKKRFFRNF